MKVLGYSEEFVTKLNNEIVCLKQRLALEIFINKKLTESINQANKVLSRPLTEKETDIFIQSLSSNEKVKTMSCCMIDKAKKVAQAEIDAWLSAYSLGANDLQWEAAESLKRVLEALNKDN